MASRPASLAPGFAISTRTPSGANASLTALPSRAFQPSSSLVMGTVVLLVSSWVVGQGPIPASARQPGIDQRQGGARLRRSGPPRPPAGALSHHRELLKRLAGAHRHAGERRLGQVDGNLGLGAQALVEPAQER